MSTLEQWARKLKRQVVTLSFALSHPRTPLLAKLVAGLTLLYAISPIDLIPDFIPVLGYLDDMLIVPIGVYVTIALIPADVWQECEASAARAGISKLVKDWRAAVPIVILWGVSAYILYSMMGRMLSGTA